MAALFVFLTVSALVLIILYYLSAWKFNHWKKKKVPHLKPKFLFGNYADYILLKKAAGEVTHEICMQFPNEPYVGTYYGTVPALVVKDPELLKLILAKDFTYFSGREITNYCDREIVTRNMFFTYGNKWKVMRQNLSPLFTVSKLKSMFPLIQSCARQFEDMLKYETSISSVLDTRTIMSRFMMDSIISCAFGVESNVMGKDSNNPFKKIGDLIFKISTARGIAIYTRSIWPAVFYGLGFSVFPKTITDFFHKMLSEVYESRGYKPSQRNDFVDSLLQLKTNGQLTCESIMHSSKGQIVSIPVDNEFLAAQSVLFLAAGFETSATTTTACLYQLAKNNEVQTNVFEEISKYLQKNGGKIEYDCTSELPYLEACIEETMRLQPALLNVSREVMEPYTLPTGLKLDKGTKVHIPIYHMHRNPAYFPDPEVFKPERFLPENKNKIIPYTYMPFGEGQRICIGIRVAKMQMIPSLITVLRKYHVELAEGMPRDMPFEARALVTQTKGLIRLKYVERE